MGNIERNVRKRKIKRNFQDAILGTVAAAGLVAVAFTNVPVALKQMGLIDVSPRYDVGVVNRARNRLLRQGLLERDPNGFLRLTERGRRKRESLDRLEQSKKKRRWDGKWRILIFDIPEERRPKRRLIRGALTSIGFVRLQDSVWAYPYDCEDYVALLKADFKIGKDLLYLVVEEMEGDRSLRAHFGLPQR